MLAPRRPATGPALRVGETFRPDHVDVAGAEASRPPGRRDAMNLGIVAAVFPIIFLGELPDKTMFASLVLSSRGRPRAVWVGAAGAFLVHAAIATTVGAGLFAVLPTRAVDGVVAALFLAGAIYAFVEGNRDEHELVSHEAATHRRVVTTAFVVIFIAEWGDLTQILTANLAVHYHAPLSVAVGAVLAVWTVAAIAVVSGQGLLRYVKISVVRRVTGVVLLGLAAYAAWSAIPH
jgi:Ca2+/H+ antiporter, TMEM165/GDT1 family